MSDPRLLLHHRASQFVEGLHYRVLDSGCWQWLGAINGQGYGTCGTTNGEHLAHRASFTSAHGPIIGMRHIHHRCEVKPCINPAHLESLTPAEHRRLHGRADSDLEWEDVNAIRELHRAGVTIFEIADGYGLGKSQIYNIVTNVKWHDPEYVPGFNVACEECGETFRTTRVSKRFCSKEHCRAWNSRRTGRRQRGQNPDGSETRSYQKRAA